MVFKQKEIQKTQPIEKQDYLALNFTVNGENYKHILFLNGNKKDNYTEVELKKSYGNLKIKFALAPIYFVNTFENLIPEVEKATGIQISRSPMVDIIPASSPNYYAIVVVGETYDNNANPIVDKFSSRIILVNEDQINSTHQFYINDVEINLGKNENGKIVGPMIETKKVSGIEEQKKEIESIIVYPNPIKKGQEATIEYLLEQAGAYKISLYNLQGQKICTINFDYSSEGQESGKFNFHIPEGLAAGTYLIALENEKGKIIYSQKIMLTE